jgi:GT2 family glycosyltransferase
MKVIECSVVIPSFNRKETLSKVLHGLAHQTVPLDSFEVIVVLDGSTDGSNVLLACWQKEGKFKNFRWILQENQGQANARNKGAEIASSPILVFLDDDVVPVPCLLEAHLSRHAMGEAKVILGDAHVVLENQDSLYHLGFWAWWEDKYYRRSQPLRKSCSRDFCSGNFSIKKEDFLKIGGFDPGFRLYGGEDYELGYRIIKAGKQLVVEKRARAQHYHTTSVKGVLRATRQEAHGDFLMGLRHPELKPGLRLSSLPEGGYLWVVKLAIGAPLIGDMAFWVGRLILPWLEKAKMRMKWQMLFNLCRGFAYWRGVRDVFGSWKKLRSYQKDLLLLPISNVDIKEGIPVNIDEIWVEGPGFIQIMKDGKNLGMLKIDSSIEEPLGERLCNEMVAKLRLPLALSILSMSSDRIANNETAKSPSGKNCKK